MGTTWFRRTSFQYYRLRSAGVRFAVVGLAVLGLLATVIEIVESLGAAAGWKVTVSGLAVGLLAGVAAAVRTFRGLGAKTVTLPGRARVTVRVGDFIDAVRSRPAANCAFGANDEFSVHALRRDSAHADFLNTFFAQDDESRWQAALDDAVDRSKVPAPAGGPDTVARHRYGTVVCQPFEVPGDADGRLAFLVANSSRQTFGFLAEDHEQPVDPVSRIFDFHREKKLYSETVVFSLIGTGHSRSRNAMQSVFSLIDRFIAESEQVTAGRLRIGEMVISIPERQAVDPGFDLEAVHLYLEARARIAG